MGLAGADQVLRPGDAVLDIKRAPLAAQGVHIGLAIAGAAPVVDDQHGVAARGQELGRAL